jgi:hypothetical protein
MIHGPQCPSVKALEFYPDGSVKRIEFRTAADWTPVIVPAVKTTYDPMNPPFVVTYKGDNRCTNS